jgi:hypothetical protein
MIEQIIASSATRNSPLYLAYKARVEADGGTVDISQLAMRQQYDVLHNAHWALIASGRKAGRLYCILPNTAAGDIVFSRNSKASGWNASGKMVEVPANKPAFDWKPISGLFEGVNISGQATNSVTNSAAATYTTPVGAPAPIDNPYAWSFTDLYTHAVHFPDNSSRREARKNFATIVGVRYCISVFIKMDDNGVPVHQQVLAPGTDFVLAYNNGATVTTHTANPVVKIDATTYLVSMSVTTTTTTSTLSVVKDVSHSPKGFRVVGWMANEGSFPARHIQTTGAAATKLYDATETAQVLPMNDVVLFSEMQNNTLLGTTGMPMGFILRKDASNYITLGYTSAGVIGMAVIVAGVSVLQINSVAASGRAAARFKNGEYALFVNGIKYTVFTAGSQAYENTFTVSATLQLGHMNRNITFKSAAVRGYGNDVELIQLTTI